MTTLNAIMTLEAAGKYLCEDRNLYSQVSTFTATQAAKHSNPDVQALAVLSVLLARVVHPGKDYDWCREIARTLGLPDNAKPCLTPPMERGANVP